MDFSKTVGGVPTLEKWGGGASPAFPPHWTLVAAKLSGNQRGVQ